MIRHQNEFIYIMVILTCDHINPQSESIWRWLPKDIIFHIFSFLKYRIQWIGKSDLEIVEFIRFMIDQAHQIKSIISQGRGIKIIQTKKHVGKSYQFLIKNQ